MTCPAPENLLLHALGVPGPRAHRAVADHVATCSACRAEVARLREAAVLLRAGAARSGDATPDCLDEEAIAASVDGVLEGDARAVATTHLFSCARCRSAVASVARLARDPAVAAASETDRASARWGLRRPGLGVAVAAAAAVVLLLAWPGVIDRRSEPHRGPPGGGNGVPRPISPVGPVAGARALQWSAVPGADRYRVTLFDGQGRVLWETQSGDTTAALPDSATPSPRLPYFWKVAARVGVERWVGSELTEFTVVGVGSPP